jgi:hypothetical protein
LNIERIPFSPTVVYPVQPLIVPGIVAFTRKTAAENREKMKPQAGLRIDGSWTHRRNGSTNFLEMVDVGSRRYVDSEIAQNVSGRGNDPGSSNGMESEALKQTVSRLEEDQKMAAVVTMRIEKWRCCR